MLVAQLGKLLYKPSISSLYQYREKQKVTNLFSKMASTRQIISSSYNTNKIGNNFIRAIQQPPPYRISYLIAREFLKNYFD
jgi:hypothetical protein